jgi:hypothetical protein
MKPENAGGNNKSSLHRHAELLRDVREEVITLLFNRYVFRTVQEIVRRNPYLQDSPRGKFSAWTQLVYGVANSVGVRRIASQTYQGDDVSFVRLLDTIIREPGEVWGRVEQYYPDQTIRARDAVANQENRAPETHGILACRRFIGEDRNLLITSANKVVDFASKRVAHSNPTVDVRARFSELDDAIDLLKDFAEKYTLLIFEVRRDLVREMRDRKLPIGWEQIFSEPWATPETLSLPLGEMKPPSAPSDGPA